MKKNADVLPEKKNNQQLKPLTPEQQAIKDRMEQRAIITSYVMRDKEIVKLFVNAIHYRVRHNSQNDEAISFKEIAEEKYDYSREFAQKFKASYLNIYYAHNYFRADKFPVPIKPNPNSRTATLDDVFIDADGTQIYWPYSDFFVGQEVTDPATTYYPMADLETVEAFLPDPGNPSTDIVFPANETYSQSDPIFVLNFNLSPDDYFRVDSVPPPPPPPPVATCQWLNYNTIADVINDQYVVSVTIPKVRLLKNFRTWVGGSNYLTMQQWFIKPNSLNVNPSTSLPVVTADHRDVCKNYQIKRADVGNWMTVGWNYNDDWKLIEYDNPMVLFSEQGWFYNPDGQVTFDVNAGLTYDTATRRFVPSFNAGAKASVTAHIGTSYEYRGSDYLSRRGVFANAVGNNFSIGTATQAPVIQWRGFPPRPVLANISLDTDPWALRQVSDCIQYYFKVHECH
ncbi:MAG: hypothetical protein M3004_01455 [Bacteroidota bacterium]|nr:hypothetical protein [Bacteroidota bacterium]